MNIKLPAIYLTLLSLGVNFTSCQPVKITSSVKEAGVLSVRETEPVAKLDIPEPVQRDIDDIKKANKLVAVFNYSPTSYFLYKGAPMGFEYEMLKKVAQELDVFLEVKVTTDFEEAMTMLNEGEVDVLAHPVEATDNLQKHISFTNSYADLSGVDQEVFAEMDLETSMRDLGSLSWGVRQTSPELLNMINNWIGDYSEGVDYATLYNKYFTEREEIAERYSSTYFVLDDGQLSEYDEKIKAFADELGWDWRLLASQIYQESKFDCKAESWAGAKGLMQVMPRTGKAYVGNQSLDDPDVCLTAGTEYIKYLIDYWDNVKDPEQRLKFVLASYNAGQGHVSDARRLAEKLGYEPLVWDDNVEKTMLMLADKKHYNDPVVKYGYARGEEPYYYVRHIMNRFQQYQYFFNSPEEKEQKILAGADKKKNKKTKDVSSEEYVPTVDLFSEWLAVSKKKNDEESDDNRS